MKYRLMGRTGLYVSEVSLGAMTFGGSGPVWDMVGGLGLADTERIVGTALDAGVNLIDTADVYGNGQSEELLGQVLKDRRDDVILTTKAHARSGPGPNDVGQTRLHLTRSLEKSLRRLQTDYIDVYMVHNYDHLTPFEETLRTLDDAVRQGKIRYLAAANHSAWQVSKALGVSARLNLNSFAAVQSYYSLVGRDAERDLLPMALDEGVALFAWAPLAAGFLTGKFSRAASDATGRRGAEGFPDFPPVDPERGYDILDVVQTVAQRHDASIAQVALAWVLAQPGVTSATVGARRVHQLTDNLGAVDLTLTEQDLSELDEVSKPALPAYPNWVQSGFYRTSRYPEGS